MATVFSHDLIKIVRHGCTDNETGISPNLESHGIWNDIMSNRGEPSRRAAQYIQWFFEPVLGANSRPTLELYVLCHIAQDLARAIRASNHTIQFGDFSVGTALPIDSAITETAIEYEPDVDRLEVAFTVFDIMFRSPNPTSLEGTVIEEGVVVGIMKPRT